MAEFDFEARQKVRSEGRAQIQRKQDDADLELNLRARKLAESIERYANDKYAIEIMVARNEVVITKKMEGFFLKINNTMTISVDSQGTFAVKKGDYDKAVGANGQSGSLTETEMIDLIADWLPK